MANKVIKEYDILKQIRKFWKINPATRIKKSKKIYNRNKYKREVKDYE